MLKKSAIGVLLMMASLFCASISADNTLAGLDLKNQRQANATVIVGGQPSKEQLAAASKEGVKHIVNVRMDREQPFDEQRVVTSLGMQYHSLPIGGADDLTRVNADKFKAMLENFGDDSVIAHCASGNRVGALKALSAHYHDGADIDAAIAIGKAWGLTRLEPAVRKVLVANP